MGEQRSISTQGIILFKQPSGENDLRITFYSPTLGKIQGAARGGRKITSGHSGHLEPLNLCEFQLYKSPVRYTITECKVKKQFKNIREDLEKFLMAGLLTEIFHKSTLTDEHCSELFQLLYESLSRINDGQQHLLTIESFKLNLLKLIGVLPNLENCVTCHERFSHENEIWFEGTGRLHCKSCFTGLKVSARQIEFNIIKLIRYLNQPFGDQTKKITLSTQQKDQLKFITGFFLHHFIGQEILAEKMVKSF